MLRELFVHSVDSITKNDVEAVLSAYYHASVVVVTKDIMAVCNPTSKQLAMAHQLEPLVTTWKFFRCKLNADTYKQVIMLLIHTKLLNELKFVSCNLGNTVIEMLCKEIAAEDPTLIVHRLHFSSCTLTSSVKIVKAFASTIKITELYVNQSSKTVAKSMLDDVADVVLCDNKLQINFGVNHHKFEATIKEITTAFHSVSSLSKLLINNSNITEEEADDIAAVILKNNQL